MSLTFTEWLLLVLTALAAVAVVYVVKLLTQVRRTVFQAEAFLTHLNTLTPRLDRILAETEGELLELRKLTGQVDGIAQNLGAITGRAAQFVAPAQNGKGDHPGPLKFISAAFTGARVVMQLLRSRKEKSAEENPTHAEETE
jgi:hypothetical protein